MPISKHYLRTSALLFLCLIAFLFTNGCYQFWISGSQASQLVFKGPLTIAIHQDLKYSSLEKDLISQFASSLKIKINFIFFNHIDEAAALFRNEKVDLVFSRAPYNADLFQGHYSMVYDDLSLTVLCSGALTQAQEIFIPENYYFVTKINSFSHKFTNVSWRPTTLAVTELRKKALAFKEICYLTDTRLANRTLLTYPQLKKVWSSPKAVAISWVTRQDLKELNQIIHIWFQNLVRKKQVRKFWDRYESVDFKMTLLEQRRFKKDIDKKLPLWRKLFEKSAKKNQIPWTLLAAVAYQESKWNEHAVSYTGVKGLMQLTKLTAKHIGIQNREDPKQSISGGAFYLKYLYDKTPTELLPYERWALALSAYNMGWAHLRDARRLAKKLNKDPYRWSELKKILPLLANKSYAKELTFGPARGEETVIFVDQVLGYTDLLNNTFTRRSPTSQDF